MEFIPAVKTVLKKYNVYDGRASRSEFWWWLLFLVIMGFSLVLVQLLIGLIKNNNLNAIFSLLKWMVICIPTLSVSVRRLHDLGKTKVLPVISFVALLISDLLAYAMVSALGQFKRFEGAVSLERSIGLWIVEISEWVYLITMIWVIILALRPGTKGDNRYGPDPLAQQMIY